uniref:Uncharacterized protein n=1 Tax=Anguilla anguilla TaxID=7936 RepID=A0A0E9VU13_ANGAN
MHLQVSVSHSYKHYSPYCGALYRLPDVIR